MNFHLFFSFICQNIQVLKYPAFSLTNYLGSLPEDRKSAILELRQTILNHLPKGFEEQINSFGLHYVVPIETFPAGYHCTPGEPLPFLSVASQKNFIAIYHLGIYAHAELLAWFVAEYPKFVKTKLDMGKSCIRFKSVQNLPLELIGALCEKMTVDEWIGLYEYQFRK